MEAKRELHTRLNLLAAENVLIGTSSWKYPGWCGLLYDERRYMTRNRFSKKRFEETCLEEYAEVFKTVCVDAGYYKFPEERYIEKLVAQVPTDFTFSFKVTEEITVKNFPNHQRYGARAGLANTNFLNADLFTRAFLRSCEPHRRNIGVLMFEFSQFHQRDFAHGRDFVAALDAFLSRLPEGWQYGVEIRNKTFLVPEYFEMLARHRVAHVYNSWTRMPPVEEQMAIKQSQTADFVAARFLLTPGTGYDKAVKSFSPYTETKAVDEDARAAGKTLIEMAKKLKSLPSYIFINNRLEGNALYTIMALLSMERAPDVLPSKPTTVAQPEKYPAYWMVRLALMDVDRVALMVFRAVYEVTEATARATYTKEAALFDIGTEDEITAHCVDVVTKAAHEFADARYDVNNHSHTYDYVVLEIQRITSPDTCGIDPHSNEYDLFLPDAEQITGLDVERENVFTSSSGVRVWLQDEEHPEQ